MFISHRLYINIYTNRYISKGVLLNQGAGFKSPSFPKMYHFPVDEMGCATVECKETGGPKINVWKCQKESHTGFHV